MSELWIFLFSYWFWLFSSLCILSVAGLWLIYSIGKAFTFPNSGKPIVPVESTSMTTKEVSIKLFWMSYKDINSIYKIENRENGNFAGSDFAKFYQALTNGMTSGVVAKIGNDILGYMILSSRNDTDDVFVGSLVVEPRARRNGLATEMLFWFFNNSPPEIRRSRVFTFCRESNVAAQLLLKKFDFQCTQVMTGTYQNPDEDGYYFERPFYIVPEEFVEEEDNGQTP